MKRLWIDLETRSRIPIKRGLSLYATDVEIIMAQWAVNDGEIRVEENGAAGGWMPSADLAQAMLEADEIWAHGAEFEQIILATADWFRNLGVPQWKWRCTMALLRMHGMPGALDKASHIFKLGDDGKLAGGKDYIQIFCVPKKDGSYNDAKSHPVEWMEFMLYGEWDIVSMRAFYRKCPKWNATPRMWACWHLDQRMNFQGVEMDLLLAQGALTAAEKAKKKHADRTEELTDGDVETTNQRNRLLAYLADYGVVLPDLKADTVERRLEDESLPETIKELLRIRQQASKASTAKYKRVLAQNVGGRLRNLLVFCGALRTGRWAGRTFQPQNLPRPKFPQWDIDEAIKRFQRGDIEAYAPNDVLGLAASCLRGLMIAGKGRTLVVADLANIEGRDMAWIAGEDWKLKAFAAYDAGLGPDLYKVAYARAFGIDPNDIADEGDWRRQIGKVMELALQYYGGVGAFLTMAETYGLRLEQLAEAAWPIIPAGIKVLAREHYARALKRRRTYGVEERVWLVCECLVIMWRKAHPKIVQFWADIEKGVKMAISHPGVEYRAGRCTIDRYGNWLRIRLPSGRYLSYPAPQADENDIRFLGVNSYTRQWQRISTYSGKLAENIVQANSADILMDGLLAADLEGYNPVLSVHDEIICEPLDKPEFNDKDLSRLMTTSSPWAKGMPLSAKGFTAKRYKK